MPRFKGEAVALVVGLPEIVRALDLTVFPITWTETPHSLTPGPAKTAAPLHPDRPDNLLIKGFVTKGAVSDGFDMATHTAEAKIDTAYVEHAYIEPEAGTAWMDGDTPGDPGVHPGPSDGPR